MELIDQPEKRDYPRFFPVENDSASAVASGLPDPYSTVYVQDASCVAILKLAPPCSAMSSSSYRPDIRQAHVFKSPLQSPEPPFAAR